MERCGFKCVGCGSEKEVFLREVVLYGKNRKKVGAGSIFLCDNCYTIFGKIKEALIEKGVFTRFVDSVDLDS